MFSTGRGKFVLVLFFIFTATAVFGARVFAQNTSDFQRKPPVNVKEGPHFVLSLYHFNLQTVFENTEAKNRLVRQAFDPLLDLYLKHPDWGCDISLDGMFVDFIAAYYPNVMEKLRKLVTQGQVELVAFNYVNTLAMAFPLHDHEWGDRLTEDAFGRLGIQRAPVAFLEEGQFGAGVAYTMKSRGFYAAVVPASTLDTFHKGVQIAPLYRAWQGFVVPAGANFKRSDFSVDWNYFGVGDTALTNGKPLAEPEFALSAAAVQKHEKRLADFAAKKYIVCRITDYVKYVRTTKFAPTDLPVLPDSTWGGSVTSDFFLWMGWYASPVEKDIENLSAAYEARNELVLTETLISYAKKQGADTSPEESLIRDAWKAVLLSESTSCTGPAPGFDETEACLALTSQARDTAVDIIRSLKMKINLSAVEIDSYSGEVKPASNAAEEKYPPVECPLKPAVLGASDNYTIKCSKVSETETTMTVTFTPARWGLSTVSIVFPMKGNRLQFSPGMMETYYADFALTDFTTNLFVLPLANGLVGLGDGKTFIITHNTTSHLAAHVDAAQKAVALVIKNAPTRQYSLDLSIVRADAGTALQTANRMNTFPHGLR